jgi:cephalosporin hydroxylase
MDFSAGKTKAFEALKDYESQVKWHFMPSTDAASELEDNSLDFVYIDGNHSCSFVKADIEAYLPKVKVGGFIGGHDYYLGETNSPGVNQAVDEFIKESGCVLNHAFWDWWITKT